MRAAPLEGHVKSSLERQLISAALAVFVVVVVVVVSRQFTAKVLTRGAPGRAGRCACECVCVRLHLRELVRVCGCVCVGGVRVENKHTHTHTHTHTQPVLSLLQLTKLEEEQNAVACDPTQLSRPAKKVDTIYGFFNLTQSLRFYFIM